MFERLIKTCEKIILRDDPEYEPGCEYWEWGNLDDVFRYGKATEARAIAKILRPIIREIGEKQ